MLKKKITILVLVLFVMMFVSGCVKKQVVEPFSYNDSINKIPPVIEDNNINDLKNNEVKDPKKEIEEIATTTKEVMDYIEYEKINTSDWLTYYSKEYGFEIKYPKEWIVKENYYLFIKDNYVKNIIFNSADKYYYLIFGIKKKNTDDYLVGRTGVAGGSPVKSGRIINIGGTDVEIIDLFDNKERVQEIFYSELNTPHNIPYKYFEIESDYIAHATFSSYNAYSDNFDLKDKKEVQIAEEILKSFKFVD